MLPAFDASVLSRYATLAYRTARAGRYPFGVERLTALAATEAANQALTGGTVMRIDRLQVAEVLAAE
jgi:hypothetical protein